MTAHVETPSLSRLILRRHLVTVACGIGLATASWHFLEAEPQRWLASATSLTLACGIGVVWLRRLLHSQDSIHQQLAGLADAREPAAELQRVSGQSPAGHGWNRLVETAQRFRLLNQIEDRINDSLADRKVSEGSGVLDCLPDGVAVTDASGRVSFANEAFAALVGKTDREKLIGADFASLLPTDLVTPDVESRSVRPLSLDRAASPDTHDRALRYIRRPQLSPEGDLTGHVWTVRDVTQLHLAEAMRDQFVAAATHELRTPLANIRAYAETLADNDQIDREQQKRFYNTIQLEASRLARFVDDLLDVSRMQAGSLTLEKHPTDIERLIEEVAEQIRPQIEQKQQRLVVETPAKLPRLNVDKGKVAAALVNLLGNGSKYTPAEGRIVLHVEANAQRIEFAVSDTGYGIPADELPHVFDRFFRSNDDRVQAETGSGLGLTFTHEVARLHGGEIQVESEVDQGTTFRFQMPLDGAGGGHD